MATSVFRLLLQMKQKTEVCFPWSANDKQNRLLLFEQTCPFFDHLSLLGPFVLSTALCLLYSPLSPLWPSVPLRPSFPSTALCPLYGPLSPLWPSVPSTALCSLYGPLSPLKNSETSEATLFFREMFCKRVSSKLYGLSLSISYK
jgi:hypothetical protein